MKYFFFIFASLFLFFSTSVNGQNFRSFHFKSDDGLSNDLVKASAKDSLGFIWIATDGGLIRFDGLNFQTYFKELPSNYIKSFLSLRNNKLLAVTDMGVIEIISKEDTAFFKVLIPGASVPSDSTLHYPKTIYEHSDGSLWVSCYNTVAKFSKNNLKFYKLGKKHESSNFQRSFSFVEDGYGNFILFSQPGFCLYLDTIADKFVEIDIGNSIVSTDYVCKVDKGVFLLATHRGVRKLHINSKLQFEDLFIIRDDIGVSYISAEKNGNIWISSWTNGLYRLIPINNTYAIEKMEDLVINNVNHLFIENEKNMWLSTDNGIVLRQTTVFAPKVLGIPSIYIQNVYSANDKFVLISDGNSIYKSIKKEQCIETKKIYTSTEGAILQTISHDGGIWISTSTASLKYVKDGKEKKNISLSDYGRAIFFIMKDNNNNIWVCEDGFNGILKVNCDLQVDEFNSKNGIISNIIVARQNQVGDIYCGGSSDTAYLYKYNKLKNNFTNISPTLSFKLEGAFAVNDMIFDNNQNLWLGTSNGLFRYKEGKIRHKNLGKYTNTQIKGITTDKNNVLWLAVEDGLLKYSNGKSMLLNTSNGLSAKTLSYRCMAVDNSNGIWVGTAMGCSYSENKNITMPTATPVFLDVKAKGKSLEENKKENTFTNDVYLYFNYVSPCFPGKTILYQTMLIGRDSVWSLPTPEHELYLPELNVGDYSIMIRAKQSGDYSWSEPLSFNYEVMRIWYQQWWAILLYILIIAIIVRFIIKLYTRRLLAEKERLESLVFKRTTEIRDKNEALEKQQKEILVQAKNLHQANDEILAKNEEMTTQTQKIEEKNTELENQNNEIRKRNKRISEQSEKIATINKELAKLSIVASKTDNAILIMDAKGNFEWVNDGFIRMYGYSLDELIQEKGNNIIGSDTDKNVRKNVEQCLKNKKTTTYEYQTISKSGIEVWSNTTLTPIINHKGEIDQLVAIDSDIKKLKEAEHEIQKQKQNITDSIVYAKRIQNAVFPPKELFTEIFSENFILFKPRDIVSGDFYWLKKIEVYGKLLYLVVVADCTGHGVPGAFMSLLGISFLNEISNKTEIKTAGAMLTVLRNYVKNALRQTGRNIIASDGMDISLCMIEPNNRKLQYAGAYNPLYLIRQNDDDVKLIEIKGDRMPIGTHPKEKTSFTNHEIKLKDDDIIYLFSDGYVDQLGGPRGRKLMKPNLQKIILEINKMPFNEQKLRLETELANWQGSKRQMDDILLIGFKPLSKAVEIRSQASYNWSDKIVLIVDDNYEAKLLLTHSLVSTKIQIISAKNGKEAVEIYKSNVLDITQTNKIDIILMDINMPEMNGYKATRIIKQINKYIPIIIQTSNVMSDEKVKAFNAGCDDYISKPVNMKELFATMAKYLY